MAKANCPGCRRSLHLDRHIDEGDYVNCPHCRADLEVISLHPLGLDWAEGSPRNKEVTWTSIASAEWSNLDKRKKRNIRVKGSFDTDWYD